MFAFQVDVNFVGFITGKGPSSNLFFKIYLTKRILELFPRLN